jgi:hypothetical protein
MMRARKPGRAWLAIRYPLKSAVCVVRAKPSR